MGLWIQGIHFTATMHQLFPVRDTEVVLFSKLIIHIENTNASVVESIDLLSPVPTTFLMISEMPLLKKQRSVSPAFSSNLLSESNNTSIFEKMDWMSPCLNVGYEPETKAAHGGAGSHFQFFFRWTHWLEVNSSFSSATVYLLKCAVTLFHAKYVISVQQFQK